MRGDIGEPQQLDTGCVVFNPMEPLEQGVICEEHKGVVYEIELECLHHPFYGQCFSLTHGVFLFCGL